MPMCHRLPLRGGDPAIGLLDAVVIEHAAAPHRRVQLGEFHLRALDFVQQRDVMPGVAEIHALQHGALLPAIVVAGDDDRGTRHARELLVDEIDHVALDAVVVEQVAGDEEQIGPGVEDGIDHAGKRIAHVLAIVPVVQVDIGSMRDLQRSYHRSYMKESAAGAADGPIVAGSRRR